MQFFSHHTGPSTREWLGKSILSDRVHSWRFNKSTELQLPLFFLFTWDLHNHHDREPGHDNPDLSECSASHPMYYFLSNLSFVDLCYSSVTTPKMLVNFVSEEHHLLCRVHKPSSTSSLCLFVAENLHADSDGL